MGTLRLSAPDNLIEIAQAEIIKHPNEVLPISMDTYVLFGDESTAPGVVTYGLICFEGAAHANSATFAFQHAISQAGAGPRVHSRELFSGIARGKTAWQHLTEEQTWRLGESLIEILRDHYARFYLGVVYKDTFPLRIPDGGAGVQFKDEHCYAFGFTAASAAFGHGARLKKGEKVKHLLFVDPQRSKATFWGIGHVQISRMMRATGLEPQAGGPDKHLLLDAADLFAYSGARALSEEPARNKAMCERILHIARPVIGHHWWQAPSDEISPKMKRRLGMKP